MEHEGGDYPQGLLTSRFPQTILLALHILTEFSFYRKTSRFQSRIHFKVLDPGVVRSWVLDERARQYHDGLRTRPQFLHLR